MFIRGKRRVRRGAASRPDAPVLHPWQFAGLAVLVFFWGLLLVFAQRLARRMEVRADQMAAANEPEPGTYARALARLYEANQIPAVMSGSRRTHPHLYDRLIAAGVTPDYPRAQTAGAAGLGHRAGHGDYRHSAGAEPCGRGVLLTRFAAGATAVSIPSPHPARQASADRIQFPFRTGLCQECASQPSGCCSPVDDPPNGLHVRQPDGEAVMNAAVNPPVPATRPEKIYQRAIVAAVIAGACTFLNVYCTQPLLPFFQQVFHASEIAVSLTVGAVTFSVALAAPFVGLLAETFGRKKVIVPALFAMAVTTLLAATAQSLPTLVLWRFVQGLFVPGVIAVIMAYINEEFAGRAGTVMAAYVAGTVFGGFLGRFLAGLMATHWNWRATFVVLGCLDLLGALLVRRWLPLAVHFVPARHVFKSLRDAWGHLRNPRLLAIYGMGFAVLFSLVGVFTYSNFHLAQPPFGLSPAGLGSVFFVYLLGCVVTPLSGRFLDRHGFRRTTLLSVGMSLCGLGLTLASSLPILIAGLALFSSGIFVAQTSATVLTGRIAGRARSAAAGLYVTFYYAGGSVGTTAPAWFWVHGGWPACVGLFAFASAAILALGWTSGRPVRVETAPAAPRSDSLA